MRRYASLPIVPAAWAMIAALALSSPAGAATVVCNDDGETYNIGCAGQPSGTPCVSSAGTPPVGCCNKGTCDNAGVCQVGQQLDALCLDDENSCTDDTCVGDLLTLQPICTHTPEDPGTSCDTDEDVCTLEECDAEAACTTVGADDCSAEEAASPAPECKVWQCHPTDGCRRVNEPNETPCNDRKDCTLGDVCKNGNCSQGAQSTVQPAGTLCRDTKADANDMTWCHVGTCNGGESCTNVSKLAMGASCDPNPCTESTCDALGGNCIVQSCNAPSVTCPLCGGTACDPNGATGGNANTQILCGCIGYPK